MADCDTQKLGERALTRLRLNTIGFIFQSFNRVGVLGVYRNVELPLLLQGNLSAAARKQRVLSLLAQRRGAIWTVTFRTVASHVQAQRALRS